MLICRLAEEKEKKQMQELETSREVVAVRKKRATEATALNSTSADARLLMFESPLGICRLGSLSVASETLGRHTGHTESVDGAEMYVPTRTHAF